MKVIAKYTYRPKASNRAEIKGSAATGFKISGASGDVQRGSRNIYVGKVKAATSTKDMRDHLRDIGVSHVSDVLELSCKVIGQTSFCITVDTAVDEDLIFKPNSWPSGIRIRPYKELSNNKTQLNRLDTSKSYPRNNCTTSERLTTISTRLASSAKQTPAISQTS